MSEPEGARTHSRRRFVRGVVGAGAVLAVPAVWWAGQPAALKTAEFSTVLQAEQTLNALLEGPTLVGRGAWDLPRVLNHVAQSIEYAVLGFPSLHAAWFRASVGPLAARAFSAAGQMRHDVAEPIPGAPTLHNGGDLSAAVRRVLSALHTFEQHDGELAPHFAYGMLDKVSYRRAHLMHLADHWREFA